MDGREQMIQTIISNKRETSLRLLARLRGGNKKPTLVKVQQDSNTELISEMKEEGHKKEGDNCEDKVDVGLTKIDPDDSIQSFFALSYLPSHVCYCLTEVANIYASVESKVSLLVELQRKLRQELINEYFKVQVREGKTGKP
jgi:hypothetical protein